MPPELFTENASAALKDRMPYVTDGPDGPFWTSKNGMSFGLVCGVGPAARSSSRAELPRRSDGGDRALRGRQAGIRRVPIPPAGEGRELDGVDAEVIFGILGAATRLDDTRPRSEMFRIYNDWLVDFCRTTRSHIGWPACRTATSTPR
jgi:hypothetical protein